MKDIFLRAHTVAPVKRRTRRRIDNGPRWPHTVLIFDTETTIDTRQTLTFGAFRRGNLVGDAYKCIEEGLFYADDISPGDRRILDEYVRHAHADLGIKSFPPKLALTLYSQSAFIEKCLS